MARKPDKRVGLVSKTKGIERYGGRDFCVSPKENNMKCFICKKQIQSSEEYDIYGLDGDFIHLSCKPKMEELIKRINEMSEEEFIGWLCE